MRRGVCSALLAPIVWLLLVFLSPAFSADPDFPSLTGRVVDEANLLDPAQEQTLTDKLAALEEKSTDQLVIVTLKSLQGYDIADFGVRLARHWAIGQKDKNNGVLLMVAPKERKMRIEVGYGLEATLTDAISRIIISEIISPRFKADDMPGGIAAGADAIIDALTGDVAGLAQRAKRSTDWNEQDPLFYIIIGIWLIVFFYIFYKVGFSSGSGSGGGSGGGFSGGGWSSGSSGGFGGGGFSGGGGGFGGGGSSGGW